MEVLEKNTKKTQENFSLDVLEYLSQLKYTLKIEKNISLKKNYKLKFDICTTINENL